jgi:NAD(P)-dependent dehydrogenase (short-subunit alcohol dehydrogenase family)
MSDGRPAGRVAIVTGGAGGIGGATATNTLRLSGGTGAWDPAAIDPRV